jgi:hypothetical protein
MNTTANRFKTTFCNSPILDGGEFIEADLGAGVTVRAYVKHNPFAQPCEADLPAFNADDLRFCDMALHVYIDGARIERDAACLSEITIAEDNDSDGDYLTEAANDLLNQIDLAGIVGDFAAKAAAAAKAMKAAK